MKSLLSILVATLVIGVMVQGALSQEVEKSNPNVLTKAQRAKWEKELSNWGRWGKDDQIGALNLVTPEKRKQAAALVKEGVTVSLAGTANLEKAADNPSPYEVKRTGLGGDTIAVSYHGMMHTHLDSLAHIYDAQGRAYNGYTPDKDQVLKSGHTKNSVLMVKNGIFTRGILMDIPRLKGVKYLEPGTAIYPADLEAWEKMAGVKVQSGDAILIRTGRWVVRKERGPFSISHSTEKAAGLHPSVIPWLKQRDAVLLGGDNAQSVAPSDGEVHDMAINVLGMQVIDQLDLETLSEMAAARKRWEFLFFVAPLPIPGGTGSPVNPIAGF